jgi:hypothetical protein
MKCIKCGKEVSKSARNLSGGRCPSCYNPFVTEPLEDGLTDAAIKSAEDDVSANGRYYFLKENLQYELQRKLNKSLKWFDVSAWILLPIFLMALIFAIVVKGIFLYVTLISGLFLAAVFFIKAKGKKSINQLDELINKWMSVNPHEKLLTAEKYQTSLGSKSSSNIDEMSFNRVLICEHIETVNLLTSNLFHVRHACPVLCGAGYPEGVFADILQRLKQNPKVNVFLLHDYSPAGQAFARHIKTDPKWFGGQQRATIVDLGLNANQKKLFKSMTIKQIDRNKKVKETAEVALFQPATLIDLCSIAIKDGVPFDLVKLTNDDN